MTHTPGPWTYKAYEQHRATRYAIWADGCSIPDTNEADARLMAAAPDLLAALLQLNSWFDRNPSAQIDDRYLKSVRAAIKKAIEE